MPTEEKATNQVRNQQQVSVSVESQPVNVELHSDVELKNGGNAHSDSKISTHERDIELLDGDVHSDSNSEPRLSKYVKWHHPTE